MDGALVVMIFKLMLFSGSQGTRAVEYSVHNPVCWNKRAVHHGSARSVPNSNRTRWGTHRTMYGVCMYVYLCYKHMVSDGVDLRHYTIVFNTEYEVLVAGCPCELRQRLEISVW